MDIKLEDLKPEMGEFTLKFNNKNYSLRPASLEDEVWMDKTFGDSMVEIFQKMKMEPICRIVYRLMSPEDQLDFGPKTVRIVNEDTGEEISSERIGGYKQLMRMMIGGAPEKLAMLTALTRTLGLSRPIPNQEEKTQKKTLQSKQTGQKSSISSARNTAGAHNTSSVSRSAK